VGLAVAVAGGEFDAPAAASGEGSVEPASGSPMGRLVSPNEQTPLAPPSEQVAPSGGLVEAVDAPGQEVVGDGAAEADPVRADGGSLDTLGRGANFDWAARGLLGAVWQPGLYGGCEFVWIRPYFARSEAFDMDEIDGQPGIEDETEFRSGLDLTPRAHLGWRSPQGYGFRATYWQYDHRVDSRYKELEPPSSTYPTAETVSTIDFTYFYGYIDPIDPILPSYADSENWIRADAYLEMQTLDLEFTGRPFAGWWGCEVVDTFGARYARHDQCYKAYRKYGYSQDYMRIRHGFEGWGLTASREMRRPLARWGLTMLGRLRASLLWTQEVISGEQYGFLPYYYEYLGPIRDHEVRGIFEGGLGLEHRRDLGPWGILTLHGTVEGQAWSDAGSPLFEGGALALFGVGVGVGLIR
jgi:hypothetical protein